METFKDVNDAKSWVWLHFGRSMNKVQCKLCNRVLKYDRSTSNMIKHMRLKHTMTENTTSSPRKAEDDSEIPTSAAGSSQPEEECPPRRSADSPARKRGRVYEKDKSSVRTRQDKLDKFLTSKHTLRSDMMRLICESNVSMNQIVKSATFRRLLCTAHPRQPGPPKSGSTLTKYLHEDAQTARDSLRESLKKIVTDGMFEFLLNLILRTRTKL